MTMRRNLVMLTIVLGLLAGPAMAQEIFPSTGYVTGTDVYLRCGPGVNAYPVGKVNTSDAPERVKMSQENVRQLARYCCARRAKDVESATEGQTHLSTFQN